MNVVEIEPGGRIPDAERAGAPTRRGRIVQSRIAAAVVDRLEHVAPAARTCDSIPGRGGRWSTAVTGRAGSLIASALRSSGYPLGWA